MAVLPARVSPARFITTIIIMAITTVITMAIIITTIITIIIIIRGTNLAYPTFPLPLLPLPSVRVRLRFRSSLPWSRCLTTRRYPERSSAAATIIMASQHRPLPLMAWTPRGVNTRNLIRRAQHAPHR